MSNTHFTVGDWLVDATANTIMRNSTLVQIAPRLVDMLVFLLNTLARSSAAT